MANMTSFMRASSRAVKMSRRKTKAPMGRSMAAPSPYPIDWDNYQSHK